METIELGLHHKYSVSLSHKNVTEISTAEFFIT